MFYNPKALWTAVVWNWATQTNLNFSTSSQHYWAVQFKPTKACCLTHISVCVCVCDQIEENSHKVRVWTGLIRNTHPHPPPGLSWIKYRCECVCEWIYTEKKKVLCVSVYGCFAWIQSLFLFWPTRKKIDHSDHRWIFHNWFECVTAYFERLWRIQFWCQ